MNINCLYIDGGMSMYALSTILVALFPILFGISSFIVWFVLRLIKPKLF